MIRHHLRLSFTSQMMQAESSQTKDSQAWYVMAHAIMDTRVSA